jgi:hypothetical protein
MSDYENQYVMINRRCRFDILNEIGRLFRDNQSYFSWIFVVQKIEISILVSNDNNLYFVGHKSFVRTEFFVAMLFCLHNNVSRFC